MEKSVTLKDLAGVLGVSLTTVSKALNNHPDISERRRMEIKEVAERLHYVPNVIAKNLRKLKSSFVGLIITDISNPVYGRVVQGVQDVFLKYGYYIFIMCNNESPEVERKILTEMQSLNCAGVIITPAMGNHENIEILRAMRMPYVLSLRYLHVDEDNYVVFDNRECAFLATDHLLSRREQKVLFLNGAPEVSVANERYQGYAEAHKSRGVPFDSGNVTNGIHTQEDGYQATLRLLDSVEPPFSLLCYSDYVAAGAMKALHVRDVAVPGQVAVMGIDDDEILSFMHPALSTVHVPKTVQGSASAELLYNLINNPDEIKNRHIVLKPSLVIRDST